MRFAVECLVFAIVAVCWAQAPAAAHEQAIGLTEISIITPDDGHECMPQTCRIEVAHRLSIHDAESTLMNVLGARADLVSDPMAQDRFETYVAGRFALADAETGASLSLTLLGGEVERGYYWVYQEGPLETRIDSLTVTHGVLMDAIPRQTNRVNIKRDGAIRTLVFKADPGPQTIRFR